MSLNDDFRPVAYLSGMLAGARLDLKELFRDKSDEPCVCDRENAVWLATLKADAGLREMLISQGEAESEEELYAQVSRPYGCESNECKTVVT